MIKSSFCVLVFLPILLDPLGHLEYLFEIKTANWIVELSKIVNRPKKAETTKMIKNVIPGILIINTVYIVFFKPETVMLQYLSRIFNATVDRHLKQSKSLDYDRWKDLFFDKKFQIDNYFCSAQIFPYSRLNPNISIQLHLNFMDWIPNMPIRTNKAAVKSSKISILTSYNLMDNLTNPNGTNLKFTYKLIVEILEILMWDCIEG